MRWIGAVIRGNMGISVYVFVMGFAVTRKYGQGSLGRMCIIVMIQCSNVVVV